MTNTTAQFSIATFLHQMATTRSCNASKTCLTVAIQAIGLTSSARGLTRLSRWVQLFEEVQSIRSFWRRQSLHLGVGLFKKKFNSFQEIVESFGGMMDLIVGCDAELLVYGPVIRRM